MFSTLGKGPYSPFTNTLWYSCYVLQSSPLTETQWIYRNFIGQETKPGHIQIMRRCHDKQKIPVMRELQFGTK